MKYLLFHSGNKKFMKTGPIGRWVGSMERAQTERGQYRNWWCYRVNHRTDYGQHEPINRMVRMFNFFPQFFDASASRQVFQSNDLWSSNHRLLLSSDCHLSLLPILRLERCFRFRRCLQLTDSLVWPSRFESYSTRMQLVTLLIIVLLSLLLMFNAFWFNCNVVVSNLC